MTLTAQTVHDHLRTVGTWVDWDNTCDGFKHGAPDAQVRGIAVGWQSLQVALEEAHNKGLNLFITHEPTYYAHMDDDPDMRRSAPAVRKAEFLDRTGMVVYRCHDVWDVFPKIGIVDAWSAFLELGKPIATAKYYNLHEVPTTTAWELAGRIANRVSALGEQSVGFVGPKWRTVSRLAVGTGAITDVRRMVELGADVVLATDDGMAHWMHGAWMADCGLPLIIANHMTAEVPGLYELVEYLQGQFPGVPVEFVGPTCNYELLATQKSREQFLRMRCDDLGALPPVVLPPGYDLRSMAADEAWAYIEVMNGSNYFGQCDEKWFKDTFSNDSDYDPSYLCLIWRGDRPVAAAAAWHHEIQGERWGMIHWVGASNTERGKGLGKAVTLAAMHRLRERGFARAFLNTHTWRLPAVAAYLSLGFAPWPVEGASQEVWDRTLADMEVWRKGASACVLRGDAAGRQ